MTYLTPKKKKMGQSCVLVLMFLSILHTRSISFAAFLNISTDQTTLLAIKTHITNSYHNNILATNWSQGTFFCTWAGITCGRRNSRVTGLDLFDMNLQGTIPREIGKLSFLKYLDMSNNSFHGPIPDEVGNLRRLRVLKMSNNQLTGMIPWNIFNLSSLQIIEVTRNQLIGTLPDDICSSPSRKLEELQISENQLNGNIPTSLSRCQQLKVLVMSSNNFTGSIPGKIGDLSQLRVLAVGGNNLTGHIPPSIGNLSNLERLDMGRNNIQGIIPSEIGLLSSLTWLNLQVNKLHGEIPSSIFNLSRLQILSLAVNEVTGNLPSFISEALPDLQGLYLATNRFTGQIPLSISNLSRLNLLSLGNNSFNGHIPITLENLHELQVLNLAQNQFTNDLSIPEQDFLTPLSKCMKLRSIDIGFNPITGTLPKSLGSSNLSLSIENLIADTCRIKGEIPNEIGNLTKLVWLHLGDNDLTGTIPSALGSLENLQRLTLYGNKLQGSISNSFCRMKSLYYASVSGNKLSGELPGCLGNMASLDTMYFNDNAFNSNIPRALWFNERLRILQLSNNLFSGPLPQEVGDVRSFLALYLSGNQLSGAIPSAVGRFQNLMEISLSDNKLNGPIPELFADLRDLQYLDLSHNNLSGSISKSLETLSSLTYFNVSFNELTGEIPDAGPFLNFTSDLFRGNKGLCGDSRFEVEVCKRNTSKSSKKNVLLRYVLPPVASVAIAATVLILFLRYLKTKSSLLPLSTSLFGLTYKRMSYYEVLRATNNLDEGNLIGKGSVGSVYKGIFSDSMVAAVKVFNLDVQGAVKSFDTECHILRSIRHRNLVKVITSCTNHDFKALVLEYIPNGNLDKWLYSPICSLNIAQRLGIMIDVASAIEYLHHGFSSPIAHCDIKPSNILLNEDMVALVGDFGIAKLLKEDKSMPQTKTLGTIGYMAPEYGSAGIVSTMADVYSYGILLMETFTRKKPTNEMFLGELSMKRWVSESIPNAVMQITDPDLLNTGEEFVGPNNEVEKCLIALMEIALHCTMDLPEERLNMTDTLVKLEKIRTGLNVNIARG